MVMRDAVTARERLSMPDDLEAKRQAAIAQLGERWLLHPSNAPKRQLPKPEFRVLGRRMPR